MRIEKLAGLFIFITLVTVQLLAQTASTSLNGTVADPKGAVIPDATVTLANPDTGFHAS